MKEFDVNRIKEHLAKRSSKAIHPIEDIVVRDLIITGPRGQFDSFITPPIETNESLIERLFSFITQLANEASNQHVKDNLIIESKEIDSKKINAITRLITSEYLFYPSKKQGPIPESFFKKLIEKLEVLAMNLPENVHLALGTFPVMVETTKIVHNQMLYIQCGPQPQINLFAKIFSPGVDPQYPHTTNEYYSNGFVRYYFDDLKKECLKTPIIRENCLKKVELLRPYFLNNEYMTTTNTRLIKYKNDLESLIGFLSQLEKKLNTSSPQEEINAIFLDLEMQWNKCTDILFRNYNECKNVVSESIGITDRIYGGNIECTTAGGVKFWTTIDICLDFGFDVAKTELTKNIARSAGRTIFPELGSQILSAHSLHLDQEDKIPYLTKDKRITHADPRKKGLVFSTDEEHYNLETNEASLSIETDFWPTAYMGIYPLHRLTAYTFKNIEAIKRNNKLTLDEQALAIYNAMHPKLDTPVDAEHEKKEEEKPIQFPEKNRSFFSTIPIPHTLTLLLETKQISPFEFGKARTNPPLVALLAASSINLDEFKEIIKENNCFDLIRRGRIDTEMIKKIHSAAPFLLKEPSSFVHVFAAMKDSESDSVFLDHYLSLKPEDKFEIDNKPYIFIRTCISEETYSQTIDTSIKSPIPIGNISMMVLGGFIAALGIVAVTLAFTLLNATTFGFAGVAVASIGSISIISGMGLFASGVKSNGQKPNDEVIFDHQYGN